MKTLISTALVLIATLLASPAMATPVYGQPVDAGGNPIYTTDVTWVYFYIPLTGSEEFQAGQSSDYCRNDGGCTGGTLAMHLHFGGAYSAGTEVTIDFNDLDVEGFGDTSYFFEVLGLTVTDGSGNVLLSLTQQQVQDMLTGNQHAQQLVFNFDGNGGDFYIHMEFGTGFDDAPHSGYWNTLEALSARAVGVPEPGTLALLGAGLLFLGLSRRRHRARLVMTH